MRGFGPRDPRSYIHGVRLRDMKKKMKTPIQELIDKLYELSEMHASDMYKAGMRDAAIIAETMLEKEKEFMKGVWLDGRNSRSKGLDPMEQIKNL